jgi:hypothetical protein
MWCQCRFVQKRKNVNSFFLKKRTCMHIHWRGARSLAFCIVEVARNQDDRSETLLCRLSLRICARICLATHSTATSHLNPSAPFPACPRAVARPPNPSGCPASTPPYLHPAGGHKARWICPSWNHKVIIAGSVSACSLGLKINGCKYCWRICCERKTLLTGWK